MPGRSDLAVTHLRLRLRPLHRALAAAVRRQTELAARLTRPDLTPFCVTTEQAEVLLDQVDKGLAAPAAADLAAEPGEVAAERELRREAAAAGVTLPLDELAARFRLGRTEQDALLLVVAPELSQAYERLYAYVVDNLNRRLPCVELLGAVLCAGAGGPAAAAPALRRLVGPAAPLLRYGLVRPLPGATTGLARELAPAPGLLDLLLGAATDAALVGHDPGEVAADTTAPHLDAPWLRRLGRALAAGQLDLVGLWGAPPGSQRDAALAVAGHAGRPLRSIVDIVDADGIAAQARTAAALDAILWLPADDLPGEPLVADVLARSRVPVVVTGVAPWRPVRLLAARAYAELELPAADFGQRRAAWAAALPGLDPGVRDGLAARYRMTGEELRAVAEVTAAGARFAGNGRPAPLAEHVAAAVGAVTRGRARGFVQAVTPRRTPDDLVLPPEQFSQVMEIAAAFRAWPRVAEAWGFDRRMGETGVKVLFTGESGTGKTLSAEVLAGMAGLELLKVDLSQVVSKWVGETEKNLEQAFRQAEQSQAVLFFDEADALFGKRGEVRHGTDRYANLEVGYLLQRLEGSAALAILASNLRENIDAAFTRRFHFAVNFARPGPAERRRLWRLAFPPEAPLAADVDVEALSRLDMTGAAIASAARTAALLAADAAPRDAIPVDLGVVSGQMSPESDKFPDTSPRSRRAGSAGVISMRHVVGGVARQFQREARLLRPADLGPYAELLRPGASGDA
jgi:hypothetical protein